MLVQKGTAVQRAGSESPSFSAYRLLRVFWLPTDPLFGRLCQRGSRGNTVVHGFDRGSDKASNEPLFNIEYPPFYSGLSVCVEATWLPSVIITIVI